MSLNIANVDSRGVARFTKRGALRPLKWVADPWAWLPMLDLDLATFFNSFANIEAMLFPDADSSLLRQVIYNKPGVVQLGTRGFSESNNILSGPQAVRSAQEVLIRERGRAELPLSLLLWFPAVFYSTNKEWRQNFYTMFNEFDNIPSFHAQLLKKIRTGQIGQNEIDFDCLTLKGNSIVTQIPKLKNTLFDPEFLASYSGLRIYQEVCNLLANSKGNYIDFVKCTSDIKVNFNSHETITATALTIQDNHNNDILNAINANVTVLNEHSFGNEISPMHLMDNVWVRGVLNNATNTLNNALFEVGSIFELNVSTTQFQEYLVYRFAGNLTNSNPAQEVNDQTQLKPPIFTPGERQKAFNQERDSRVALPRQDLQRKSNFRGKPRENRKLPPNVNKIKLMLYRLIDSLLTNNPDYGLGYS